MYKDLQRTCTAVILLIKTFIKQSARYRCHRGLLKLPNNPDTNPLSTNISRVIKNWNILRG